MSFWMVAVDGSADGDLAFRTAMRMMDKKNDRLFIVNVVEELESKYSLSYGLFTEVQERLKDESSRLLHAYGHRAKEAGVTASLVRGLSTHSAEFLCNLAEKKNIDVMVMGRRGMGSITRFFVGSTTTYVLEHSKCNVMVVKHELPAEEVHDSDRKAVARAEEAERQRRIDEERDAARQAAFKSALDKNIVKMAEEEERMRRIKDEKEQLHKEKAQRQAEQISAKIDEETERKRRIAEDGLREDRKINVDIYEWTHDS